MTSATWKKRRKEYLSRAPLRVRGELGEPAQSQARSRRRSIAGKISVERDHLRESLWRYRSYSVSETILDACESGPHYLLIWKTVNEPGDFGVLVRTTSLRLYMQAVQQILAERRRKLRAA